MEADLGIIELEEEVAAADETNAPINRTTNATTEDTVASLEAVANPQGDGIGDTATPGDPNATLNAADREGTSPGEQNVSPSGTSSIPADVRPVVEEGSATTGIDPRGVAALEKAGPVSERAGGTTIPGKIIASEVDSALPGGSYAEPPGPVGAHTIPGEVSTGPVGANTGPAAALGGASIGPEGASAKPVGTYTPSKEASTVPGRANSAPGVGDEAPRNQQISQSPGESARNTIQRGTSPDKIDSVKDDSTTQQGLKKLPGSFKLPAGHGFKMPGGHGLKMSTGHDLKTLEGHDSKMPEGHGIKVPVGHGINMQDGDGFKMPTGRGFKMPTGHSLKIPTGRGFKFPSGGRKRSRGKRTKSPGQGEANRNEDHMSHPSDALYDSEYDVAEDESLLETFDGGFAGKDEDMIISPYKTLSENFETVVLKIETQNNVINSLKGKIKEKARKFPKTMLEENEIHNLNVCIQEEQKKLQIVQRAAIRIQEYDRSRKWPPLRLATTYIEDCMPIKVNFCKPLEECLPDKYPLIKAQNHLSRPTDKSSGELGSKNSSHSDLFASLDPKNRRGYKIVRRSRDPLFQQLLPENRHGYPLDPKKRMRPHYVKGGLPKVSTPKLSKTTKREIVDCIQGKIDGIQKELRSLECKSSSDYSKKRKMACKRSVSARRCVEDIANVISRIQSVLEGDCNEKNSEGKDTTNTHSDAELSCPHCFRRCKCSSEKDDSSDRSPDKAQLQKMYCELLEKYDKKEREVTRLKATVRTLTHETEVTKRDAPSKARSGEICLLKDKLQQYRVSCDDMKVLICEQARQIDDYRVKYMTTLQKVEEQSCLLQKMEVDNRRIEDQINLEIQRIKDRFQDKLNQYVHLPQLLENEQIKLAACCRQKDDLEMKLRIVCREYRALKILYTKASQRDDPERCRKLNDELANLRQQFALITECKDRLSKENEETRNELDTLRAESARIIVRLKERATSSQANLQRHIDELEKDLAKCRAAACLSVADRDCVIKDMQAQLNCLALSFDSSQKQIKTLKDHIAYLSHGKAESVVICCQPDGDKQSGAVCAGR